MSGITIHANLTYNMKHHFTIFKRLGAATFLLASACKPPAGGGDSHAGHAHEGEAKAAHVQGGICQEHLVPEGACGICNPDKIAGLKPGESLQLRLASGQSAAVAGIQTAKPGTGLIADGIECYAELGFNLNQVSRIASPVSGVLQEVSVALGSQVGERLVVARIC